ncbi:MAG TPA: histidine phosphatase family protein [Acidimicrobiales bacterium]|jgi:broad specificity phosphatase PhoE
MDSDHCVNRSLWLVRHGESTWNRFGLIQGHDDRAILTPNGVEQAHEIAARLALQSVVAIYSSDLDRAGQTAAPIAVRLGLTVHADARLRERCLGTCEGQPLDALTSNMSGIVGTEIVDTTARPDQGETLDELYRRTAECLDEIAARHPQGDVVVVAHGGSLRTMRAYCLGLSVADMTWGPVPNATVWPVPVPSTSRLITSAKEGI